MAAGVVEVRGGGVTAADLEGGVPGLLGRTGDGCADVGGRVEDRGSRAGFAGESAGVEVGMLGRTAAGGGGGVCDGAVVAVAPPC